MGTKLEKALAEIRECLELGFKMTPPIKGVGLQLISFASNKPDLFNTLIKNNKALSTLDDLESYLNIQGKLEALAAKEFDLSRNEATQLCSFLWIFELGLATIVANARVKIDDKLISNIIGQACRAYVIRLRVKESPIETIIPVLKEDIPNETYSDYINETICNIANKNTEDLRAQLIEQDSFISRIKTNPRYLRDDEYQIILTRINSYYNKAITQYIETSPSITKQELRICLLLAAKFSTKEIAILTGISYSSVSRSKLRAKRKHPFLFSSLGIN